jgi:hypothetical protein
MADGVGHHELAAQRRRGRRLHIGRKLEPDPQGAERLAIVVDEQALLWWSWLSFQQLLNNITVSGQSGHMRSFRRFPVRRTQFGLSNWIASGHMSSASCILASLL